jgi:hypothetical protein
LNPSACFASFSSDFRSTDVSGGVMAAGLGAAAAGRGAALSESLTKMTEFFATAECWDTIGAGGREARWSAANALSASSWRCRFFDSR